MVKVDSLIEEAVTPNTARTCRYINCKLSSGYEQEAFSFLNNYERVFTLIPPLPT